MRRLSWSVVWGICAVDLFKFDSAIWTREWKFNDELRLYQGFSPFRWRMRQILLLANLFSHLLSLRMWKFLSGFGRTRCADTAAAFLGRPEFSGIRFLTWVCAFLRVKRETFSHSWKKTQNKPSGHRNPSFQFYWAFFWFVGRITYWLFRPLPAPFSLAFRRVLGGNRLAAVCAAERSDSECPSEFQSG